MAISIAMVDDHQLNVKSLVALIESFAGFEIVVKARSGSSLIAQVQQLKELPDIVLVDVNMPEMDGIQTTQLLLELHPGLKIAALTMNDDDRIVIRMLKAGGCAYLLKDIDSDELEKALHEIFEKGSYNGDAFNVNARRLLLLEKEEEKFKLTDREQEFLRLACSELTYKQVAVEMSVSERTVDEYRERVFRKMSVQSRVGMVIEAIKKGLVKI